MKFLVIPGPGSIANPAKGLGPNITRVKAWVEGQGGQYSYLPDLEEAKTIEEMVEVLNGFALSNWPPQPFKVVSAWYGAWPFLLWLCQRKELPAGYRGATLINPRITPPQLSVWATVLGCEISAGDERARIAPKMLHSMRRNDLMRPNSPLTKLSGQWGSKLKIEVLVEGNLFHAAIDEALPIAQRLQLKMQQDKVEYGTRHATRFAAPT